MRDLEAKLSTLEASKHLLQSENERLVLTLRRVCTVNIILQASSMQSRISSRQASVSSPLLVTHPPDQDGKGGKHTAQSADITRNVGSADFEHAAPSSEKRNDEISATETWDRIQSQPLGSPELNDIADLYEQLKGPANSEGCPVAFKASATLETVYKPNQNAGPEHPTQSCLSIKAWPCFPF